MFSAVVVAVAADAAAADADANVFAATLVHHISHRVITLQSIYGMSRLPILGLRRLLPVYLRAIFVCLVYGELPLLMGTQVSIAGRTPRNDLSLHLNSHYSHRILEYHQ